MRAHSLARVRNVADQQEGHDGSESRAGSSQPAYRCHRPALKQVRGQRIRHDRETRIGKGHDGEQESDQVFVRCENRENQQRHPDPAVDDRELAREAQRLSPPDQISRKPTRKKASCIGDDKRNPQRDHTALQVDPLSDEVNRKPLRDEEEDWVGRCLGDDRSPSLG